MARAKARSVIAMVASAGGVEALRTVVSGLSPDLSAAVVVVMHSQPHGPGMLAGILQRSGRLPAIPVTKEEPLRHGHIYVAPPDWHLVVRDSAVLPADGPKENGFRPAADPLFRAVAATYRERAIGVVMTGGLDDGTSGLQEIKQAGGIAVVQSPGDAQFPDMPRSAMMSVDVDYALPAAEIPGKLMELASRLATLPRPSPQREVEEEPDRSEALEEDMSRRESGKESDSLATFTCPGCGGLLWELRNGDVIRYRCHVGHLYSPESLEAEQSEKMEVALWAAVRALEERASMWRRLASRMREHGSHRQADRYLSRAETEHVRAQLVVEAISRRLPPEEGLEASSRPPPA